MKMIFYITISILPYPAALRQNKNRRESSFASVRFAHDPSAKIMSYIYPVDSLHDPVYDFLIVSNACSIFQGQPFPPGALFLFPLHANICSVSGGPAMKGYSTASGFMGYVDGRYILFACEEDYLDFITDTTEEET